MKDYMTVKEIADLCGKTEKTVRNWISKVFPVKMENGVETRLLIDEVEKLFNSVFGQVITSSLMENTTRKNLPATEKELPATDKLNYHLTQAVLELQRRDEEREKQIRGIVKVYGKEIKQLKGLPAPQDEYESRIDELQQEIDDLKKNYYPVPKPLGPRSRRERGMWQDRYDNY
jgi:predicted transcriptional regulator